MTQFKQWMQDAPVRPVRITLIYFIFGLLWMLACCFIGINTDWKNDELLFVLFANRFLYAVLSSLFLYVLLRKIKTFPAIGKWNLSPKKLVVANFLFCLFWIAFIRLFTYLALDDFTLRAQFIYVSGLLLIGCSSVFLFLL